MPERYELVDAFKDTLRFFGEEKILRDAITFSVDNTKIFPADFSTETDAKKHGEIRVMKGRTLQTALHISREFPNKKIAVLNFASSITPGGGIWKGSKAQEESICRSSTLYYAISSWAMLNDWYIPNKKRNDFRADDSCIYSPRVMVCKDDSDEIPQRLRPEEFISVDVITCAAPHIHRGQEVDQHEMYKLHVKRAENILRVAAFNDVDIFVGGAFGCGAFHNDPHVVARAWNEALKNYSEKFECVIFAIYSRDYEGENLKAFKKELI